MSAGLAFLGSLVGGCWYGFVDPGAHGQERRPRQALPADHGRFRHPLNVDLVVNPCRSQCRWLRSRAGAQLFTCRGCGSQWQPGQGWTPMNADGHVPTAVRSAAEGNLPEAG